MFCRGITVDGVIWWVYYTANLAPIFATSSGSTAIPSTRPCRRFDPDHIKVSFDRTPRSTFTALQKAVRKMVRTATPIKVQSHIGL